MAEKHPIVLYVEDDEGDRFFMEHAFKTAGLSSALRMVHDGRAAVQYLAGTGQFADRALHPVPRLVLLDLKLPELSGFEVLEWLRKRSEYASLPVIIFSSRRPRQSEDPGCQRLLAETSQRHAVHQASQLAPGKVALGGLGLGPRF